MKRFLILFLVSTICFAMMIPLVGNIVALAATTQSSGVLEDLMRDPAFRVEDYPSVNSGRDLKLITIAETIDKRLVLYVYQSYANATYYADFVRMSNQIDDNTFVGTCDYPLQCLSHEGVFYKYLVVGLEVSDEEIRHYNIIQISRRFYSGIDPQSAYDNTINRVPFLVAKQFTFQIVDGVLTNTEEGIDVVTITDKYVGFVRIESQVEIPSASGTGQQTYLFDDLNFIAFNCDRQMDRLIDAKVSYYEQHIWKQSLERSLHFGVLSKRVKCLSDETDIIIDKQYYGNWDYWTHWIRNDFESYQYSEIQSIDEFLDSTNREYLYEGLLYNSTSFNRISAESEQILSNMTWVLNFAQTSTTFIPFIDKNDYAHFGAVYDGRSVSGASILQLTFDHDGETYQLGVVDGEATSSGTPDNEYGKVTTPKISGDDLDMSIISILKLVIGVVGGAIALILLLNIISHAVRIRSRNGRNRGEKNEG